MKCRIFCAVILVMTSCGLAEIGGGDNSASVLGGIWGGPLNEGTSGALDQICYVTALDYQKGYDWKSDTSRESVKCSLVVYADGKLIMKVPVGDIYETSADPDMHRVIDGQLYTDYSTDSETVIRKNGVTLFRYPGREAICGMQIRSDDVYTLGQNRSWDGFAYRRNGEVIFSRSAGAVMGQLRNAGDSLCFAYYDRIQSADGDIERYYTVCEGKVTQIAVRADIKKVWDIISSDRSAVYLASVVGVDTPVLIDGDKMTAVSMHKSAVVLSASLFESGGSIGAEIMYRLGGNLNTLLWFNGMVATTFPTGMMISSLYMQDNGICCAVNPAVPGNKGVIYRCGERFDMPLGYNCVGSGAVSMVNGILHAGLSSVNSERPVLWKDGQLDTLMINGYISSVCAQ